MRLLADAMLGSLGRWLRLLGYDTAIAQRETDAQLVRQARADNRVILTRDRELARRRAVQTLLVVDDDLDAQLAQVLRELQLPQAQPFSRCPRCNQVLEPASPAEVAGDVPPYVLQTQTSFRRCPTCRRVYWRGTHWQGIVDRLGHWLQDSRH